MLKQSIVLEFDKNKVCEDYIIRNINYYILQSSKGMEFISEGKKKDAMKILNKLKKNLKKEYSYYNKDSVKIFIEPNNVYRTYH